MKRKNLWTSTFASVLGMVAFVLFAGNTAPMCGQQEDPEYLTGCLTASECEGLPHAECDGAWACKTGECSWECTQVEPVYCSSDAQCGEGEYCTISDGDCYPGGDCMANGEAKMADPAAGAPCMSCLGVCKVKEVQPPELCTSDADCGEDQYCTVGEGECLAGPGCGDGAGDRDMACAAICYGECKAKNVVPVSECEVDSDCQPGFTCQAVDCITPPCADGEACMEMCAPLFKCVNTTNPEDMCQLNSDCKEGERCTTMDGQCITDTSCGGGSGDFAQEPCLPECWGYCIPDNQPPPSECNIDEDCGPEFFCQVECWTPNSGAAEQDMMCQIVGKCLPKEPLPECMSDEDCAPGYICQVSSECGDCYDAAGVPCAEPCMVVGYCVPGNISGCASDWECGAGFMCQIETICTATEPTDPADPNSDPAPWIEECVQEGTCVPTQQGCVSDSECPMGYFCELQTNCLPCAGTPDDSGAMPPCEQECLTQGVCQPQTQPSECYDDTQCGAGYVCQMQEVCPACVYEYPPCKVACQVIGTCVPAQSECQIDADCGPGYTCQLYEACAPCPYGDCLIACPLLGKCVQTTPTCYSDMDCGPGYMCELVCPPMPCAPGTPGCGGCSGTCKPVSQCAANSDCPAGYECKIQTVCYDYFWCDPNDPTLPCGGECVDEGLCVLTGCQGVACAEGEVLDTATCTCKPNGGCMATGCSGEICAAQPVASTCVWFDWYECLQAPYTTCGPFGPNGECQWQATEALANCLAHF